MMDHPGTPHQWGATMVSSADFFVGGEPIKSAPTYSRQCEMCGYTEYGVSLFTDDHPVPPPRGFLSGGVFNPPPRMTQKIGQGRGSDGHEHVWAYSLETKRTAGGIIQTDVRRCQVPGCGAEQRKLHGANYFTAEERDETLKLRADPLRRITLMADGTAIYGGGKPVEEFGGIVAYDPSREMIQLGDGGEMTLEVLVTANPAIPASLLTERLENLPSRFYSPFELSRRLHRLAEREEQQRKTQEFANAMAEASPKVQQAFTALKERMEKMGESLSSFSNELSSLMNTDDALTLILETIRNAGSPQDVREAASQWLTRVTTEISRITRSLDEDE